MNTENLVPTVILVNKDSFAISETLCNTNMTMALEISNVTRTVNQECIKYSYWLWMHCNFKLFITSLLKLMTFAHIIAGGMISQREIPVK